ncbi:hypothetical protein DERP_008406 [Dermatophagoides pteronyssinus]|uniref:Peptidase M12A domain-containing protein n=1 Tax=Dermatophagoides pteronyssinus TaxID=6956 RepID=A0ABQ8IV71_DERPT|nr:hypothetical protein DERP_008406 [Dermatophagoides pteronyssinus]
MIYGSYAFSRNGRPTMLPKNHSIKLRESHFKQSLSSGDIININAINTNRKYKSNCLN